MLTLRRSRGEIPLAMAAFPRVARDALSRTRRACAAQSRSKSVAVSETRRGGPVGARGIELLACAPSALLRSSVEIEIRAPRVILAPCPVPRVRARGEYDLLPRTCRPTSQMQSVERAGSVVDRPVGPAPILH